jgi:Ran GTPase-activating protein (RanGAP) involved in mRNA processing and transport
MKLSTKSIGLEAAPVVASAVANVSSVLSNADVSDIIAGRPEAEVLQVLKIVSQALAKCPELLHLDISDNALGEKGIRACTAVLTDSSKLRSLRLQNIGCSVNACRAVNELVQSSALDTLHLFNNMSDNEGANAIAALLSRNKGIKVHWPRTTSLSCSFRCFEGSHDMVLNWSPLPACLPRCVTLESTTLWPSRSSILTPATSRHFFTNCR